jgi:hypothetical protein
VAATILMNIGLWTSPFIATILLFLYLRYARYSRWYGWGVFAVYAIHQTFCLLFLTEFLGMPVMSTLLAGPFMVLDLTTRWSRRSMSKPNSTIKYVLLGLTVIVWIFAGVAILRFATGF